MDAPTDVPATQQKRRLPWPLIALVAVGAARALSMAVYAAVSVSSPWPIGHLEAASVHFASRVQHGLALYPDPYHYPYVANLMGPVAFGLIGLVGWLVDADLGSLYVIGRLVTVTAAIGASLVVAVYLARRYGPLPAIVGGLFALGAGPMIGYGVMTRPDVLADLMGMAGFLLATTGTTTGTVPIVVLSREAASRKWDCPLSLIIATTLLALACLTKQTAAAYALAAIVACTLQDRHAAFRRAMLLALVTAIGVLLPLIALAFVREPYLMASLAGQGAIPWDHEQRIGMILYLMHRSPEIVWFSLIGAWLWTRVDENRPMLILSLVLWGMALVSCGKLGSDLNYFLSLRLLEALAAGSLCAAALRPERARAVAAMLLVSVLAMLPSTWGMTAAAASAIESNRQWASSQGQERLADRDFLAALAADPRLSLLSDDDQIAACQGSRAAIVDMYLFRLLVEQGRADPSELVERIEREQFDVVVLSADVEGSYHNRFVFRLPEPVAQAVRAHYRFVRLCGPWRIYVPKGRPDPLGEGDGVRGPISFCDL